MAKEGSAEKTIRDIKRKTRRKYGSEEKIRIVMEGLRGEETVVELIEKEENVFEERPCPETLSDNSVTILYTWGTLFFASSRTMENLLPDASKAKQAVVILRLHGHARIGSTFIQILERYAGRVQTNGGKILLSGVTQNVWEQLSRTETFETIPEEDIFLSECILGGSTKQAMQAAENWLNQTSESQ